MKIQTLDKIQQNKLLKLCKQFFPEYESIRFNESYSSFVFEGGISKENESINIHWYQLCLTELPKRIWKKVNTLFFFGDYGDDRTRMSYPYNRIEPSIINSNIHPVDFLWNFVKVCKKRNYFLS